MAKRRQPNGAGTIRERKDGTFEGMLSVKNSEGKSKRKSFYGKTPQEVFDKMDKFKLTQTNNPTNQEVYYESYLNQWLYTVKKPSLKITSFDRLDKTLNKHVIPKIGHYRLNELTPIIIQENLINAMEKEALSLSSIKKAYYATRSSCEYALGQYLVINPCNKVVLPSKHNFTNNEIEVLSDRKTFDENDKIVLSEIDRFKNAATAKYKSKDQYIYRYGYSYILMLNTGMRTGEALALKWNDIDFKKPQIRVSKAMVETVNRENDGLPKTKYIEQSSVKTNSSNRTIPLNPTSINALLELKKINFSGDSGYIIEGETGKPVTNRNYLRSYKAILKRSGIKDSGLHTLRHTFATQMFSRGVDVKVVSELLGHADVNVTYNTYVHLINQQKVDAVMMIDDI